MGNLKVEFGVVNADNVEQVWVIGTLVTSRSLHITNENHPVSKAEEDRSGMFSRDVQSKVLRWTCEEARRGSCQVRLLRRIGRRSNRDEDRGHPKEVKTHALPLVQFRHSDQVFSTAPADRGYTL